MTNIVAEIAPKKLTQEELDSVADFLTKEQLQDAILPTVILLSGMVVFLVLAIETPSPFSLFAGSCLGTLLGSYMVTGFRIWRIQKLRKFNQR